MEKLLFANNAESTAVGSGGVVGGILSLGGTSLNLTSGGGSSFPSPSSGEAFFLTIFEKPAGTEENIEVVKVTSRTADNLTIVRNIEGATYGYPTVEGRTVYVAHRLTALTVDQFLQSDQNLADLDSAGTARTNLGLGDAATKNVGTGASDVAAGGHTHSGVYEPADATILKDADIGVTVQAYDAATVKGPASATDGYVALFNGITGKLLKESPIKTINSQSLLGTGDIATPDSFRNKIIGGDFTTNPWQRGTSFTAPGSGAWTADRWFWDTQTDGVVDVLKTADAPTAAEAGVYTTHCIHADVTTADTSLTVNQVAYFVQKIEGYNAAPFGFGQSGSRSITLSFWHKHTKAGTYCVSITNSAHTRSYVAEYTQDVSDAWEKAIITIPVDTTGTWLYDTGIGLRVYFTVCCSTTSVYTVAANSWLTTTNPGLATANQVNALDSTDNNFKIALVQLEAGSVATPFETRSVGQELALCQRYYWRVTPGANVSPFGLLYVTSATQAIAQLNNPVPMRVAATALEQSGTATDYAVNAGGTTTNCNAVPVITTGTPYRQSVVLSVASGLTAGHAGYLRATGSSGYIGLTAEL